jgi:hypothetical protein
VVSSGTAEANRAMGFRARVLLDQTFGSGLAFRVGGTPAAVLVDAEGRIASGVANGAPAVLALANAQHRPSRRSAKPGDSAGLEFTRSSPLEST